MNWKALTGSCTCADVAQQHDPGADDVGDGAHRLRRLGPHRAVIAGIGLVQGGEALLVRAQSKLPPSTMMPPIEVPCPPMYLVVECTTMAAP